MNKFSAKPLFGLFFLILLVFSSFSMCLGTAETYAPVSSGGGPMFGGNKDDGGYNIKLTSDGGLILAGYTESFGKGGSDMWLLKTAPVSYTMQNGVTGSSQREIWNVTFGGSEDDGAFSVIQTSDDGFAAAGYTKSFGRGESDMWLVKVNAEGVQQWSQTFGGANDDAANCLIQTGDGGYLLAGYTNSNVNTQTAWAVKTDSSGRLEWEKTFEGTAANSVVASNSGGYAFAIEHAASFGLITTDYSGNIQVSKIYPAPKASASTQSIVVADDGYAIAGWIAQNALGTHDSWLIKVYSSGEQRWGRVFSGVGAYDVIKLSHGGYALSGDRAVLILTDSAGNVDWCQIYDGNPSNNTDYMGKHPVIMHEVIEVTPNHFVMVGMENSGPYVNWQMSWYQVALKTVAQTVPPTVTLISPASAVYTQKDIPLTFHVNERSNVMIYSLNGFYNKTITGNITVANLPNGEYTIIVYAVDTNANMGVSQKVTFTVSSPEPYVQPKVSIESPQNGSEFMSNFMLRFSVDQQVAWSAYSIDDGPKQQAMPGIDMMIYAPSSGSHRLTVYAGQTEGTAGSATVTFTSNGANPTVYPPSDNSANNQVISMISVFGSLLFSPIMLTIVVVFLIMSLCIVIIVILVDRKASKKNDRRYK